MCCSALVHLSQNPLVVSEILQEVSNTDLTESDILTPDVMSKLPYLEQVWKELTRIAPPFGGGFRQVIKTFELEVRKCMYFRTIYCGI